MFDRTNGEISIVFDAKPQPDFSEPTMKDIADLRAAIQETAADITNYSTVAAVGGVYTIDFANRPVKNVKIETGDTDPKSIAVSNAPTDAELFIELTYTNAAVITWFENITWLSGSAPTFTEGKVYRIALFKYNTGWHGNCVGGW